MVAAALGARKTRRSTESTERLCSLLCSAKILRMWCSSLHLVCHGMQDCLHILKYLERDRR